MIEQEKLEIEKLNVIDFSNEANVEVAKIVTIFLESINDWPTKVLTLDDYELNIEKFIKNETNFINIEYALKKINYSSESWESESLYQIKEIFVYYKKGVNLKDIINDLKLRLKDKLQ